MVIETNEFRKQAEKIWSEDERLAFVSWISEHYEAGDVVPGADGVRKIRWTTKSTGKRGGARVIYFIIDDAQLVLIAVYQKSDRSNMNAKQIKEVKQHEH